MSLALIQSYSSAEEDDVDDEARNDLLHFHNSSDDERDDAVSDYASKPLFDLPNGTSSSSLPSAFDAFAEVSGPPGFLNSCVEEPGLATGDGSGPRWRHGRRRNRKEKKDLPAGAVMEAKPLLVGIHERVRSDIQGNTPPTPAVQLDGLLSTAQGGVKRMATATNPNADDAAELLSVVDVRQVLIGLVRERVGRRGILLQQNQLLIGPVRFLLKCILGP